MAGEATLIPVVCDNGHQHETDKAIVLTGASRLTTSGARVGPRVAPCPVCGAGGRIPAGTYYGPEARHG